MCRHHLHSSAWRLPRATHSHLVPLRGWDQKSSPPPLPPSFRLEKRGKGNMTGIGPGLGDKETEKQGDTWRGWGDRERERQLESEKDRERQEREKERKEGKTGRQGEKEKGQERDGERERHMHIHVHIHIRTCLHGAGFR